MDVLVADDDPGVRVTLRTLLARRGFNVLEATNGAEAVEVLVAKPVDVVITDLVMPQANGLEVLKRARECQPSTPVIMLTAEGSIRDCVNAMRAGAFNFLTKPFHVSDVEEQVQNALSHRTVGPKVTPTTGELRRPQVALIGESKALREVIESVERIAGNDSSVLITGESGTGKEVVARLLHSSSPRVGRPFVAVNCGAIPEALIESELFGHAKGAFTGATEARAGKFVQADRGTLFLDEIGELKLELQVKLLRVLQEREVTPVGEANPRRVDVRIIAATNRNLEEMVKEGKFRQDLYFRLDVIPLKLPALRDRPEDIPVLAAYFLEGLNRRLGRKVAFSEDALTLMQLYDWPGNVREMANLVERLVVMSRGEVIGGNDLPARMRAVDGSGGLADASAALTRGAIDLQATMEGIERVLIEQALRQTDGNKSRAAELLGLSRTTLLDKMKRLAD
ncbi:MAG TPA: sigma-54 dependent transcriptional regulator [Polyangia bacterium]|nr:sigma-54 dependent transcriptional regulator [Polyangia bacterium]